MTQELEQKRGKKIATPKSHSTKEMYAYYRQKNPDSKEPYWMFKEVISRFNKKVSDAVIYGQVLNFGNRIGNLLIKKIRRRYEKLEVDWGESKRIKAELIAAGLEPRKAGSTEGHAWLVYFSDPWYLRWAWAKKSICRVKNQTVYKFVPTGNRSKTAGDNSPNKLGNRGKLVLANRLNPTLHMVYENHMSKVE